jgi:hypothetical protein
MRAFDNGEAPGGTAAIIAATGIALTSLLGAIGALRVRWRKAPSRTLESCRQRVAALEAANAAQQRQIDAQQRQIDKLINGRGHGPAAR